MKTETLTAPKSAPKLDNYDLGLFCFFIIPSLMAFYLAQAYPPTFEGKWFENSYVWMVIGFILFMISMVCFITLLWRSKDSKTEYNDFVRSFIPMPVYLKALPEWQQEEPCANLQAWMNENAPEDKFTHKQGFWDQCIFVRDTIQTMFNGKAKKIEVISYHTSKSVKLPVYHVELPGDVHLVMRYNFHDWKVTVVSKKDIYFHNLHHDIFNSVTEDRISSCYCEGFKDMWVYDKYSLKNMRCFTVELPGGFHYMFMFLMLLKKSI